MKRRCDALLAMLFALVAVLALNENSLADPSPPDLKAILEKAIRTLPPQWVGGVPIEKRKTLYSNHFFLNKTLDKGYAYGKIGPDLSIIGQNRDFELKVFLTDKGEPLLLAIDNHRDMACFTHSVWGWRDVSARVLPAADGDPAVSYRGALDAPNITAWAPHCVHEGAGWRCSWLRYDLCWNGTAFERKELPPWPKAETILERALLELPPQFVADMPLDERRIMVEAYTSKPADDRLDLKNGFFAGFSDCPFEQLRSASSWFYVKVFHHRDGKAVVFTYRGHFDDKSKSARERAHAFECRNGLWTDVTEQVFPPGTDFTLEMTPRHKLPIIQVSSAEGKSARVRYDLVWNGNSFEKQTATSRNVIFEN